MTAEQAAHWLAQARWRAGPGVDRERLGALLAAAQAALARAPAPRKAGRRKALFALALAGDAPDHLLKVERHASRSLARRLGRGAALSELARARACAARGVPTPLPLAAGTVRRHGLVEATLLLLPIVPGAVDGTQLWDGGRLPRARRRALARALGTLVRTLHDAGVDQDDLAPNNFLWREDREPRLLVIDFERVRVGRALPAARRALVLARLDRHLAGASASDRMRVLRAYGGDERRSWWRAVAAAHGTLARRDHAHLLRTGTRASRRFALVAAPGVTGWCRRGAPLAEALAALADGGRDTERIRLVALGPLARRARARAWAAALVLAQRGAAPPPVALLRRDDGACFLAAEREPGARALAEVEPVQARAALVGLLDRLLAFGFEPAALAPRAIEIVPAPAGGSRARLLDPRGLRPGRARPDGVAVRAWADRLVAEAKAASGSAGERGTPRAGAG